MIEDRVMSWPGYNAEYLGSLEGWFITFGSGSRISCTASSPFKNDEEALAFVQQRAAKGSEFHAKCLVYVTVERMG